MKKIILASVLAVAAVSSAHATGAASALCAGVPTAASAVTADGSTATQITSFVRVGFTPRCSNNVHLVGDDEQIYYRVGAASVKGKNAFGGSSVGGAVQPFASCPSTAGCVSGDAVSAANAALSS
jgi:hypothetical protein